MQTLTITLCLLALAGCAAPNYAPLTRPLLLWVKPLALGDCIAGASACVGRCDWGKGICTLYLPADTWLDCIAHEARHASEGEWHGETPTPCKEY